MQRIDYLPIEYIFNLLSIYRSLYRKREGADIQTLRLILKRRGLWSQVRDNSYIEACSEVNGLDRELRPIPKISFWIRLCQSASLLDEGKVPFPTLLAQEWFSWPYLHQLSHLMDAWLQMPIKEKHRNVRKKLIHQLMNGIGGDPAITCCIPSNPSPISSSYRHELVGLHVLGICKGEQLSPLGAALIGGVRADQFTDLAPDPWRLENERELFVPFPPAWDLLWELEGYLNPTAPGVYLLDERAIRLAAQRDIAEQYGPFRRTSLPLRPHLPEILERGLGKNPPTKLTQRLTGQPTIRVILGPVLEFTHPEELKNLRKSPGLRRDLEYLLSSRHVALNPWQGQRILKQIRRRGLITDTDLSCIQSADPQNSREVSEQEVKVKLTSYNLNKSDRTYLLSLMLLAESLQNAAVSPPGLLNKLTENLDQSLRAAAARKATAMLQSIHDWQQIDPQSVWIPEIDPPKPPLEEMLMAIQQAIDHEESIDVLYKASGRHSAEYRHLTPLMIEPRGERLYLIAYCHTRRSNRTFRLDRLQLCMQDNCLDSIYS